MLFANLSADDDTRYVSLLLDFLPSELNVWLNHRELLRKRLLLKAVLRILAFIVNVKYYVVSK